MIGSKRFFQIVFTIVLFSAYIFTAASLVRSFADIDGEYSEIVRKKAETVSDNIGKYLTDYSTSLSGIGEMEVAHQAIRGNKDALKNIKDILSLGTPGGEYVDNVVILDKQKRVVESSMGIYDEFSPHIMDCIERAKLGPAVSSSGKDGSFVLVVPVFEQRELLGFVMSEMSFEIFEDSYNDAGFDRQSGIMLFDEHNTLTAKNEDTDISLEYDDLKTVGDTPCKLGKNYVCESDILLKGMKTGWKLYYVLSGERMFVIFASYGTACTLLFLIVLISGIFTNYLYVRKVEKPVDHIIGELTDIKQKKDYFIKISETGLRNYDNIAALLNSIIGGMVEGDMAALTLVKKYAPLFREKRIIFLEWDLINFKYSATPQYKEIFGMDFEPFSDSDMGLKRINIHPDDMAAFNEWIREVRQGREISSIVCRKRLPDGKYRYFEYAFASIRDETGEAVSALGYIMDVNRYVRTEIGLKRAADLDRSTGAYNKQAYIEKLRGVLSEAREENINVYMCIFKLHNYYDLEEEKIGLGEEALKFINSVVVENLDCLTGRVFSDSLIITSSADNLDYQSAEILKELRLGFVFSENRKRYFVKLSAAILNTDRSGYDCEKLLGDCLKEYMSFKPADDIEYYDA